jgi:hypothetical protein
VLKNEKKCFIGGSIPPIAPLSIRFINTEEGAKENNVKKDQFFYIIRDK